MLPTIAIGIPTYLRDQVLVDTLRYVLAQDPPPDEIVIVDQSPTHDEATTLFLEQLRKAGKINLIAQTEPSLTKARNRILVESTSDVVCFWTMTSSCRLVSFMRMVSTSRILALFW